MQYVLECDTLAVGLTRSPTQFGIPLSAFYFNVMISFLLAMIFHTIASVSVITGLFLIVHGLMAWKTFNDPFGLRIAWMNKTLFKPHRKKAFWNNTESFMPW